MKRFHKDLLATQTSGTFEVINDGVVTILMTGSPGTVDFAVQISPDGTNFVDIHQDDVQALLTATNNVYTIEIGGGAWFRVVAGAGSATVDLWVAGHGVY